jgi:hypothetical protein
MVRIAIRIGDTDAATARDVAKRTILVDGWFA